MDAHTNNRKLSNTINQKFAESVKGDLEDLFYPLSQIQAVADLFNTTQLKENRTLSTDGCHGIYEILTTAVNTIRVAVDRNVDLLFQEAEARRNARAYEDHLVSELRAKACGLEGGSDG